MISDKHALHRLQNHAPLPGFIISAGLCFASRFIQLPGPHATPFDVAWPAVIIAFILFRPFPCLLGISVGYWAYSAIITNSLVVYQIMPENAHMEVFRFSGYLVSGFMAHFLKTSPPSASLTDFTIFSIPVFINALIAFHFSTPVLNWIILAGIIILSILCIVESRKLVSSFWVPYKSWLVGFIFHVTGLWILKIEPNTAYRPDAFFFRSVMIPYLVYLLQILISAHVLSLILSIREDRSSSIDIE